MLAAGELDALFYSRSPWPGGKPAGSIRRLFPDPKGEEAAYFARHGFFPIMHVIAIRAEAVARSPGLPALLMQAFQGAWDIWRGYADDPNWSSHPWTKYGLEDETERLSDRLWENGLAPNRDNLELMVRYMRDQGVIGSPLELDNLFHPSVR
jgi:4,5-dihydroxyphthalate decarboxylase